FDTARIRRSKHPGDVAAPVIADQDAALAAEMSEQGTYVAEQSRHGVGLDGVRLIRWRKATQIGSHYHVVPAELRKLPRVKRRVVRRAVQEQHQLALASP